MFSRRNLIKSSSAAGLVAGLAPNQIFAETPTAKNIVVIYTDEHRLQSMANTNMPELSTPNLSRLANEGTFFTECVSNYPVCVPFRTMLMTGMWPYAAKIYDNDGISPDQDSFPTLGKSFGEAGYETCFIGKWHVGMHAHKAGFKHTYIWGNTNIHYKSNYRYNGQPQVNYPGYNATGMTDQALDFISKQNSTKPYLMMLSINPPHALFTDAPQDCKELYPEGSLTKLPNYISDPKKQGEEWNNYQGYHAHITAIDREVGRVLDAIDASGMRDNTVVVYTSDHGSMMYSHGATNKRYPYEESCRIPFIVRCPGTIPTMTKRKDLISAIDIFPTLCGLAGIPIPSKCNGQNFELNCRGLSGGPDPKEVFLMHIANKDCYEKQLNNADYNNPAPYFRGVRTNHFTYAVSEKGPWMLYQNTKDPYQLENHIGKPEWLKIETMLANKLNKMLDKAEYAFMDPADVADLKTKSLTERINMQSEMAVLEYNTY